MSSIVKKQGFIAPLIVPVPKDEREDFSEHLYDSLTGLNINHEGTLIYSDIFLHKGWEEREDYFTFTIGTEELNIEEFKESLDKLNILIDEDKVESYKEIYYNGCYSSISMLTEKEYNERFNSIWGVY